MKNKNHPEAGKAQTCLAAFQLCHGVLLLTLSDFLCCGQKENQGQSLSLVHSSEMSPAFFLPLQV